MWRLGAGLAGGGRTQVCAVANPILSSPHRQRACMATGPQRGRGGAGRLLSPRCRPHLEALLMLRSSLRAKHFGVAVHHLRMNR